MKLVFAAVDLTLISSLISITV